MCFSCFLQCDVPVSSSVVMRLISVCGVVMMMPSLCSQKQKTAPCRLSLGTLFVLAQNPVPQSAQGEKVYVSQCSANNVTVVNR